MPDFCIDGDFKTHRECEYHCPPTCHPAQVDPDEWKYACLHNAWPQNRYGDFPPIVRCEGLISQCEIPVKQLKRMISGRQRSIDSMAQKIIKASMKMDEMQKLIGERT